jgi:tripeptidyl-peptidase-1
MAVTAFLGQHYSLLDLKEFWSIFCIGLTCGKGNPITKGDASGPSIVGSGVEAMLDIETITGVAGNITSEFWGFKGNSPDNSNNEPFMKWLTLMSSTSDADVPKVFSTSYGEPEDSWSLAAATRLNVEFQKAGARGISLLFASGDSGANCGANGKFEAETPGSSPWVTAVGGTGGSSQGKEFAIGLSSGGFSSRWAQPSWQADAVKAYISSGKLPPASTGYNASNRGYPDIAAQGQDFTVVAKHVPEPGVAGTSCACPTASGVIALLNDARLAAGKSTLGFLNPWIYQNLDKWNDITKGANGGCDMGEGWPARKGWDAVTGVGTPNYAKLVAAMP